MGSLWGHNGHPIGGGYIKGGVKGYHHYTNGIALGVGMGTQWYHGHNGLSQRGPKGGQKGVIIGIPTVPRPPKSPDPGDLEAGRLSRHKKYTALAGGPGDETPIMTLLWTHYGPLMSRAITAITAMIPMGPIPPHRAMPWGWGWHH